MVNPPENPEFKPQEKVNAHEEKKECYLDWSHLVWEYY